MNYLKFLNYEQILYLKKHKSWLEKMPNHCVNTKSIFIHIPKAAGMSLVHSIYNLDYSNHDTWIEYYKRDKHKFSEYFKFSFVRNPLDRFHSAYNYLSQNGKSDIDKYWNKKYMMPYNNIEDFILKGGIDVAFNKVEHFKSQTYYICKENKIMVDFVGKYESLNTDIEFIKKKLNLKFELAKVNENISSKKEFISIKAEKKIRKIYERDFLNFDY
jgi:hypothetical protein